MGSFGARQNPPMPAETDAYYRLVSFSEYRDGACSGSGALLADGVFAREGKKQVNRKIRSDSADLGAM